MNHHCIYCHRRVLDRHKYYQPTQQQVIEAATWREVQHLPPVINGSRLCNACHASLSVYHHPKQWIFNKVCALLCPDHITWNSSVVWYTHVWCSKMMIMCVHWCVSSWCMIGLILQSISLSHHQPHSHHQQQDIIRKSVEFIQILLLVMSVIRYVLIRHNIMMQRRERYVSNWSMLIWGHSVSPRYHEYWSMRILLLKCWQ